MTLRLPEDEYKTLCKSILQRDGYRCRSCGFRGNLHVHHIQFRSQQGPDETYNLITICSSCHDGVHKDVKNGEYGLVITTDMHGFTFKRASWWRPL